MIRVFVYGTLKRGQRNAHFLRRAKYLGAFVTEAAFTMYEFDDYPAVCERGRQAIHGEVYEIDEAQLAALDELEWYPRLYQRIRIETDLGAAWMYVVRAKLCRGRRKLSGNWERPC